MQFSIVHIYVAPCSTIGLNIHVVFRPLGSILQLPAKVSPGKVFYEPHSACLIDLARLVQPTSPVVGIRYKYSWATGWL